MENKEIMLKHLAEGREMQMKSKKRVTDNGRILTLMRAGLTERPRDRDFFERIEEQFHKELEQYNQAESMIDLLEKVLSHQGDE